MRLYLLLMVELGGIWSNGKGNLNSMTLGWIGRMRIVWIPVFWSGTRSSAISTRRGRVFPTWGNWWGHHSTCTLWACLSAQAAHQL